MAKSFKPGGKPEEKFNKVISTYASRFEHDHDRTAVTDEERKRRQETAAQGTDAYYDFATAAYLNGWSEHFHYTPFAVNEPIQQSMTFYEHYLAMIMGLKPGMKVLDVGCGVGGPAREIAKFIGCEIVGITINHGQVDVATELTEKAGLSDRVSFIRGNYLHMPFPESSFDAAYAIEATCHSPDLLTVYTNVQKILKPGAPFGCVEWVMTDSYEPNNPQHVRIRNLIERGNAICNLQTVASSRQSMLDAGFTLEYDEDFALHWKGLGQYPPTAKRVSIPGNPDYGPQTLPSHDKAPEYRPWYYPIAGDTKKCDTWEDWWVTWRMTRGARRACRFVIFILEHLWLYPKGTLDAMTELAYCVDSVLEGGQQGIFSPGWFFVGKKPGRDEWRDVGFTGNIRRVEESQGVDVDVDTSVRGAKSRNRSPRKSAA